MKRLLQFAMATMMLFAACEKDANVSSDDDTTATPDVVSRGHYNYIDAYIDADTIEVTQYVHDNKHPVIWVFVDGMRYDSRGWSGETNYERAKGSHAVLSQEDYTKLKEENRKVFDSIARVIGDTTYPSMPQIPYSHTTVNDTIVGIDVVCREDYDNAHKAGSSVADIVDFYGSSPYDYIQNGYKDTSPTEIFPSVNNYKLGITWRVTTSNIANIADVKMKFFDHHFYLVFTKLPAQSGTYTFDVSIQLSKKTLRNTVTMEF